MLAGLDYYGYFYVWGRYFHASNLHNWAAVAKPVRGSTAKHKGKALPIFNFVEGKCEVSWDRVSVCALAWARPRPPAHGL